eukprot:11597-Rhodomonas_salina.1
MRVPSSRALRWRSAVTVCAINICIRFSSTHHTDRNRDRDREGQTETQTERHVSTAATNNRGLEYRV